MAAWLDLGLAGSTAIGQSTPFSDYSPVILGGGISGGGVNQTGTVDASASASGKGNAQPMSGAGGLTGSSSMIPIAIVGLLVAGGIAWYLWKS